MCHKRVFALVGIVVAGAFHSVPGTSQEVANSPVETTVSRPTRIDWTFVMGPLSLEKVTEQWIEDYPRKQTYELYVPDEFQPDRPTGLILFVSPTPRAMAVSKWKAVCDEFGFVLAAPHAAGNMTNVSARTRIVMDVLDDVRRKFNIDPERTYIGGFSGGGRVSLAIAFALPDFFGGVIPIGSAGELRRETWLHHRVADRLSVAFVAGSDDFNYTEITSFRAPLLEFSGVRTRTWIVDGIAHVIPSSPYLIDAVKWLEEDLPRRREFAEQVTSTRVPLTQSYDRQAQAQALFDEGIRQLKADSTKFQGQMLIKGVADRWPDLPIAEEARSVLMLDSDWQAKESEHIRSFLIQRARGIDAYATLERHAHYANQKVTRLEAAVLSWNEIIKASPDSTLADEAKARIEILEKLLEEARAAESGQNDGSN